MVDQKRVFGPPASKIREKPYFYRTFRTCSETRGGDSDEDKNGFKISKSPAITRVFESFPCSEVVIVTKIKTDLIEKSPTPLGKVEKVLFYWVLRPFLLFRGPIFETFSVQLSITFLTIIFTFLNFSLLP